MTDMTEEERLVAETVYAAIQHASAYSPRAMQGREFKLGVSDLGFCSERVRRTIDQQVPEETDNLPAFIGTAIGDHVEKAIPYVWPDAIIQSEVEVPLTGEQHAYVLGGHPDIILPDGLVLDTKTGYGLETARRTGANQSQQFQRHLYALGAHLAGLFNPDVKLEEVRVGNVWIDRTATEREVHVQIEPYDPDIVQAAAEWLDEVVYAFLHNEEARKEPPRDMCAKVCGFYRECRLYDTDVEGLITDEEHLAAVDLYVEGREMESTGKRLKDQAKAHLDGVVGSTGEHQVRWTWVNPSLVPEYMRAGYSKLEVRSMKKKRSK